MARPPSSPLSPSSPSTGFSEHEVPTRVGPGKPATDDGDGVSTADGERGAMGAAVEAETTSVPVSLLEAALAESRKQTGDARAHREEKSGARKRTVEREAFSVHEAETKKASSIEVRRALSSVTEGADVDKLLAEVATSAALPAAPAARPEPEAEAPRSTRKYGRLLAFLLAVVILAPLLAFLVAGRGSVRAGYQVVRGKLTAR